MTYDLVESVPIGIVQTTVDKDAAWGAGPRMSAGQDLHVWNEICRSMRGFMDAENKPKIILLPELSLPLSRVYQFKKMVARINAVAIVGSDYHLDYEGRSAKNAGYVFVPNGFYGGRKSSNCSQIIFGKTHPAPKEKIDLENFSPPWSFLSDPYTYIFDLKKYGTVGVSICYDFMDIERAFIYRDKVNHLFVLSYNQDINMFSSLAHCLSRIVYCNVVVCNTGTFGGSIATSPYCKTHLRTIYAHLGTNLPTSQIFDLPLRGLEETRISREKSDDFKAPPPIL